MAVERSTGPDVLLLELLPEAVAAVIMLRAVVVSMAVVADMEVDVATTMAIRAIVMVGTNGMTWEEEVMAATSGSEISILRPASLSRVPQGLIIVSGEVGEGMAETLLHVAHMPQGIP